MQLSCRCDLLVNYVIIAGNIMFSAAGYEYELFVYDDFAFLLIMAIADGMLSEYDVFTNLQEQDIPINKTVTYSTIQRVDFREVNPLVQPHLIIGNRLEVVRSAQWSSTQQSISSFSKNQPVYFRTSNLPPIPFNHRLHQIRLSAVVDCNCHMHMLMPCDGSHSYVKAYNRQIESVGVRSVFAIPAAIGLGFDLIIGRIP